MALHPRQACDVFAVLSAQSLHDPFGLRGLGYVLEELGYRERDVLCDLVDAQGF